MSLCIGDLIGLAWVRAVWSPSSSSVSHLYILGEGQEPKKLPNPFLILVFLYKMIGSIMMFSFMSLYIYLFPSPFSLVPFFPSNCPSAFMSYI